VQGCYNDTFQKYRRYSTSVPAWKVSSIISSLSILNDTNKYQYRYSTSMLSFRKVAKKGSATDWWLWVMSWNTISNKTITNIGLKTTYFEATICVWSSWISSIWSPRCQVPPRGGRQRRFTEGLAECARKLLSVNFLTVETCPNSSHVVICRTVRIWTQLALIVITIDSSEFTTFFSLQAVKRSRDSSCGIT
jgi:hypothetical protein